MTCKESITWLECLKTAIGQHQYRNLWNFEQPLAEIIELLQNGKLLETPLKVGDKVYQIIGDFDKDTFSFDDNLRVEEVTVEKLEPVFFINGHWFNYFTERTQAEAKLKELNDEREKRKLPNLP